MSWRIQYLFLVVRKIYGHLKDSQHVHEQISHLIQSFLQTALQVGDGQTVARPGLGAKQVHHSLGLGETDAAIEPGPFGKFPRLSRSYPQGKDL